MKPQFLSASALDAISLAQSRVGNAHSFVCLLRHRSIIAHHLIEYADTLPLVRTKLHTSGLAEPAALFAPRSRSALCQDHHDSLRRGRGKADRALWYGYVGGAHTFSISTNALLFTRRHVHSSTSGRDQGPSRAFRIVHLDNDGE